MPLWKCSIRGCKNKGGRRLDPKKCHKSIAPKKYMILCDDHKIVHEQESDGYRFVLVAQECGCHAQNLLFEPNNPKPIRDTLLDLEFTAPLLMRTWTKGIPALIKMKSSTPVDNTRRV